MIYRKLGNTGVEVGEIGMGLEHLLDKEESVVVETIKTAIEGGVNYFDCLSLADYSEELKTNEGYVKLGKALKGFRDKVNLTFLAFVTRPVSYVQADFECFLRELNTNYTDTFLLACCDKIAEYETATGIGSLLEYAKKLKAEGKAKYIGLATHNTEIAYKAINSNSFDLLMYPINPAFDVIDDEEKFNSEILENLWDAAKGYNQTGRNNTQPRKNIYSECERKGMGLVAMKPFGGGFLLDFEKDAGFTPLNLLSYALTQNGVSTVIPGCSNKQEIAEILTYYSCSKEKIDYSEAVSKSRWTVKGNCLYCHHCLPCSANINIAEINRLLDYSGKSTRFDSAELQSKYENFSVKASSCTKCGECEERCPFQVEIIRRMEQAASLFEKNLKMVKKVH